MRARRVQRGGISQDHVGHQALVARAVFADHHGATGHRGMLQQRSFDFADFDSEAADLHLAVAAAQEIDGAVRESAHTVAGAVQLLARREGVRDELLGREFGAVAISARQSASTNEELALFSGLQLRIQYEQSGVGNRAADGYGTAVRRQIARNAMRGGEGRRFGGPVAIDERDVRKRGVGAQDMRHRQRLAARQQFAQAAQVARVVVDHRVEQRSREPGAGHALAAQGLREARASRQDFVVHHAAPTVEQRTPDLERGGIEAERRGLQEHGVRIQRDVSRLLHQTQDGRVRDLGALGRARGARGVHDVGDRIRSGIVGGSRARIRKRAHIDDGGAGGKNSGTRRGVREQQLRAAVFHHEAQAIRGVGVVER